MDNFISKLKNVAARAGDDKSSQSGSSNSNSTDPGTLNGNVPADSGGSSLKAKRPSWLPFNAFSGGTADSGNPEVVVKRRKPLYRRPIFLLPLFLAAGGGGFIAWGYWKLEQGLPDTKDISSFVREGTLTIRAADNTVLQQLGPATREKLKIQKIPPQVVQAFIAAEDRRFYQHNGVDFQSIVRAGASNLLAGDVVEGASTITQQLARIVYLNQERTFGRKLQEAMLAQKIERELSKQQILEKYLNLVYLGSGAYGVADAAWVYFSKSVDQLTLAETATIAGLPPAPSDYSPLVNLQIAEQRRNVVLERMQESGFITAAQAEQASSESLKLKPSIPKKLYSDTPYFTSYIQQQLPKLVSKEKLEAGGLTVETTLDPKSQKAAEKAVRDAVKNFGAYEGFKQAALVSINPRNGEIRAMVGGTDFNSSQFNRVTQAQRQPGSAFKAILYTTAIATGMSPYTSYLDAPYTVDGYKPENYGRKYSGWMTLREALTSSVNIISVKLLIDVGFDPVIKMAQNMGIKSKLLPTYSLALGASEVNLLELTSAYGTLATQGEYIEPHGIRRILSSTGEVLYNAAHKKKRVIDKDTTAIVTWMMQNVVNSGTGRAAQIDRPVAGKTGTSEEARDLWFVGFIPQLVTGVWLGNDDSSPTWSYSSTAATVWHDFMVVAVKGIPVQKFPELPKLEGRKGSIKANAVRPNRAYTSDAPASNSGSSRSESERSTGRSNAPAQEPARDSAPPSSSAPENTAPAPVAPAEPPSEPAPVVVPAEPAPPPENTAPPEPAPPPVPASPPAP